MRQPPPTFDGPEIRVEPWCDPVVDSLGHDPRSAYVETFWLSILGPSTLWLLRRIAADLDASPDGIVIDMEGMAHSLGVGNRSGRNSPFQRALARTCQFGLGRQLDTETLAVRRRVPPLTLGQVRRLPDHLQAHHEAWLEDLLRRPDPGEQRERARRLALSLVEIGEDRDSTERQLHRWRFHPALACDAATWAIQVHSQINEAGPGAA